MVGSPIRVDLVLNHLMGACVLRPQADEMHAVPLRDLIAQGTNVQSRREPASPQKRGGPQVRRQILEASEIPVQSVPSP